MPVEDNVDIVLYDSFAQPESDHEEIGLLVANPRARRVVVYTWNFHPDLIEQRPQARRPRLPVEDSARPRSGRRPRGGARRRDRSSATRRRAHAASPDWTGPAAAKVSATGSQRSSRSSPRARATPTSPALTYLSPNTVKSYIRTIYRKIGVDSRTQAVLWGVKHGFTPDHNRIEHWRGGP